MILREEDYLGKPAMHRKTDKHSGKSSLHRESVIIRIWKKGKAKAEAKTNLQLLTVEGASG
jgi:hypothetical protein